MALIVGTKDWGGTVDQALVSIQVVAGIAIQYSNVHLRSVILELKKLGKQAV